MGKTGIFSKKELETFFSRLQALTNCKDSEKSNERFSSNRVTDGRTYVQTDVNPFVSNDFVERPKRKVKVLKEKHKVILKALTKRNAFSPIRFGSMALKMLVALKS